MQVSKWGNSLAIRLPSQLVKALDLKVGDDINITVKGERQLEMERDEERERRVEEAWRALRAMARPLPDRWKFDREEIYAEREEELLRRREASAKRA